jgi:hypothetical protein
MDRLAAAAARALSFQTDRPTRATLKAAYLGFVQSLDNDQWPEDRRDAAAILALVAMQLAEDA